MSTEIVTPPVHREARQEVRVVSAEPSMTARVAEIWKYRQLLLSLVRKELKVKYKDSVLGFAWSMLNPAFTLTIYYVVFQLILGNRQPMFALFLLAGLLVWNFFSGALAGATGSVTGNGAIVKKVSFPREVLPLASVGAAGFNFFLQSIVMIIALVAFRHTPDLAYLPMLVFAILVCTILASALSIFLSSINVPFRDTQHLLELVLMLWFWMTPIVYPFAQVKAQTDHHHLTWIYLLNPITPIVLTFQRFFYNMTDPTYRDKNTHQLVTVHVLPHYNMMWYATHLFWVGVAGCVLMYFALAVFGRQEGNFAEEL